MKGEPVFSITTCDPRFDPAKALKVNGYLFIPVGPQAHAKPPPRDAERMKPDSALRHIGANA